MGSEVGENLGKASEVFEQSLRPWRISGRRECGQSTVRATSQFGGGDGLGRAASEVLDNPGETWFLLE